ncbi:DUF1064 domain-containing protein [Subdoligranulum sp. DSM 109015]|uniref:DUF1064 domain-containing protein n=1 Tax=Gemmiger gallinarum TaxID=2779354 RepID=A0ABR9R2I6_9FIRM|nr:DUF1064 domain-containing protein [Gemmiger gallinarum]MBE5037290.1 DUF1064 domain-containing protein [Gemmiger gallinarum]
MTNKYHARKVTVLGHEFDSKKEADRFLTLCAKLTKGEISDLRGQVEYELIPAQKKANGKTERAVKYIADFVYRQDGKTVVEDVKGYRDGAAYRIFAIKRKLMLQRYGIEVKEI